MSWFYLALLAPVLYAVVNLFDDNLLAFVYKSPYLATSFAGFFGLVPLLALYFKSGSIAADMAGLAIVAGIFTVSYLYFYFRALDTDAPSIVVALLNLAPATIPILAYFLLGERLSGLEFLGFLIVLVASLGIAAVDIRKFKFSAALIPACISVLFIDAAAITSKHVYNHTDFFPAYMFFSVGMGIGGLFFLLIKWSDNKKELLRIKKRIRPLIPVFLAAELTALAAEFTLNLAISKGPVSLVKVIESVQPMFVLLIALVMYPFAPKFFREAKDGNLPKKFSLMAVAVIGLAIISYATKS